ncbi:MAG: XrtA-associated ATPase [gamma proteobacterium symbiont of Lucinoma myriamae]|nr:XrtA-associated ATPase [gamma proteobacterium symbiont of Lucinoma myriamae]MCU7832055.1 XrtA-associated ATPase [gamma proteobacterium symbiont of Lucinoma myriamae]
MYKDYYNLKCNPFQMTPDPKVFFASKGHKRALSYLQYGLRQGEGFIVITGDVGTGKTTIVKTLIASLDNQTYIAKELVTTHLEEQDLMEMICESFELISKGLTKAALLNQFKAFLNSANKLGRRVVLIVDEVQNLPAKTVEELRMLSNFQVGNKPLIQSFLVGQKEFIRTLQADSMEQLRQRVIASCHLGPLKSDETQYYINYRLAEAGWDGGQLFDDQAFQLIHELTEGVPRRINVFCDRILLFGYLEEITYFTQEHIKTVADELADEITSPIKTERHEEINAYLSELQVASFPKKEKKPSNLNEQFGVRHKPVQPAVTNTVDKRTETISSDFVDIEETIKNFELKVEQEIATFKKSLGK